MITIIICLVLCFCFSNASRITLQRRQNTTTIDQPLQSIKSALYAVNRISNGTSTSGCQNANLTSTLNSQGYDGRLAHLLLYLISPNNALSRTCPNP